MDGISAGSALGYRRGAKGGTWIAKFRDEDGRRHLEALGAADDARDAEASASTTSHKPKSRLALGSSARHGRQPAGLRRRTSPYTVADALADYRADYLRRGGKTIDRLDWSSAAWIGPELGPLPFIA